MWNQNKTTCGAIQTEGEANAKNGTSLFPKTAVFYAKPSDRRTWYTRSLLWARKCFVLWFDLIQKDTNAVTKRCNKCTFGLHYRKISDRLSSLISPCQSIQLREQWPTRPECLRTFDLLVQKNFGQFTFFSANGRRADLSNDPAAFSLINKAWGPHD